jgi:hypothetical protein
MAEYFRDTGKHALIVYDDLSKQSVAYRQARAAFLRVEHAFARAHVCVCVCVSVWVGGWVGGRVCVH